MTMDTTIDQQVARDEALVPHAKRLRIGRRNFRLLSDIKSKESTLQLVYDVLRLTPFFKAYLVTADVLEICMQEFWATTTIHHHSIRFKMDNKKHIINLESFREMLHIFPRLPHQPFVEPPFEEEILAFLCFLKHNVVIRKLTDVNINKLHQPWRSFAAIINKCLTAQIMGGLYHKRNVDFAYLMWEDFVYQVEHKDTKKSNEMYYPRFTKVIIHHFMSNDPSIPRRNKVNWHYVRDDHMNSNAYKEYYAVATGVTPPKPKASVRKTRSSFDTTITPPTAVAGPRLTISEKGKQAAKASKAKSLSALFEVAMTEAQQLKLATKRSLQQTHISQVNGSGADEGIGTLPRVPDVPTDESEEEISWNSTDEEGDDDEGKDDDGEEGDGDDDEDNNGEEGNDDDDDPKDEGDDDEDDEEEGSNDGQASDKEEFIHPSLSTHAEEEIRDEESFDPIPKTPKNSDDKGNRKENLGTNVGREVGHNEEKEEDELYRDVNINQGRGIQTTQEFEDSHVTLTPINPDGQQQSSSVSSQFVTSMLNPTPDELTNGCTDSNLSGPSSHFAGAVSAIPEIVQRYMDQRMNEALKIIKEQVKEQVKVQVSKILPTIEQTVNEQLEAEVLTRSSNSSKTTYAIAADLSEMELKKILIEDVMMMMLIETKNPPLDQTGGPRDAEKERSLSQQALQRRQLPSAIKSATAEEPMQTTFEMEEPSHPEFDTGADDQPIVESSQHPEWFSQQKKPPTPDRDWNKTLPATHESIQPWISKLAKQSVSHSSFNELMDTLVDFSNFLINRIKVDTLTPELLAGLTYELMKGSCKSLVELEFVLEEVYKATTDQLDWVNPKGQQYPHNLLKP
nr:hypothetical protein [Tanacetum cinerariifolium]